MMQARLAEEKEGQLLKEAQEKEAAKQQRREQRRLAKQVGVVWGVVWCATAPLSWRSNDSKELSRWPPYLS